MPKRRTKRANGEGSVYQLPNGRWAATITVGTTADGKRRRRTRTARTQADAVALLAEMRAESPDVTSEQLFLNDWLDQWLGDVEREQAANTHASYESAVEKWIRPYFARVLVGKATPLSIRNWIEQIRQDGAGEATVANSFVVLRAALNAAKRLDMIKSNPCSRVKKPTVTRKELNPFTLAESVQIIEATKDHRLHALFVVAFHTGTRQGELFGLRWSDLDLERGRMHIRQQATDISGRVIVKPPKTKAGRRTLQLTDEAVRALQDRRRLAMTEGHAANELVFPGKRGAYLRRGGFRVYHWNPLLRRLEIEHRSFHQVRHTYVTHLLQSGVPLPTVSKIAGHSSPSVTLNVYSHVLESHQDAATETASRLFKLGG